MAVSLVSRRPKERTRVAVSPRASTRSSGHRVVDNSYAGTATLALPIHQPEKGLPGFMPLTMTLEELLKRPVYA